MEITEAIPADGVEDTTDTYEAVPAADGGSSTDGAPTLGSVRTEVDDARFPMLGEGYDPLSVDRFLEGIAELLERIDEGGAEVVDGAADESAWRSLREQSAQLADELAERRAEAEQQAADIVAAAERDASKTRLDAEAEAEAVIAAARTRAEYESEGPTPGVLAAGPSVPEGSAADSAERPAKVSVAIEAIRAIADLALEEGRSQSSADRAATGAPVRPAGHDGPAVFHAPRRSAEQLRDEDAAFLASLRRSAASAGSPLPPARGLSGPAS